MREITYLDIAFDIAERDIVRVDVNSSKGSVSLDKTALVAILGDNAVAKLCENLMTIVDKG